MSARAQRQVPMADVVRTLAPHGNDPRESHPMKPKAVLTLLKRTVSEWSDDNATTQAASLAYYTIFSIAPILIIAVAVAGALFGAEAARGEIQLQIQGLVGENGA